ncbi:HK97 gp10 family phage protein [Clostridium botulinum]|uniref:HK97 gp10 family phage protein n=1 Tax=Clostridium botulinum TaxID=1491 RepID=UPI0019677E2F|nr:HK97 gp10 family phage protein [Clostridium botulinum]MBN1059342.1 HK97 gp10 family phage protein [Clostridium botulinum]
MQSFEDIIKEAQKAAQKIEMIVIEEMEDKATECVTSIQAETPVKTGALRRSITHDHPKKIEDKYIITCGSSLEYAQSVEKGHIQEVGKYVPAIRKKLVKSFVPGKHMIQNNVDLYQDYMEQSISERIEREV